MKGYTSQWQENTNVSALWGKCAPESVAHLTWQSLRMESKLVKVCEPKLASLFGILTAIAYCSF